MHHLNVRVAWHDNRWNGGVCLRPSNNSFCVDLDRIRAERDDARLDRHAGKWFADLAPADHPPCKAEGGAFMSSREWVREFNHPYRDIPKAKATHGHLKPTFIKVPPFSTFAVPFNWMLRESQERVDESIAEELPPDEEPPFPSAWVFGRARQEAICNIFFGRLTAGKSLVFFYTKSGHPLDDAISRLLVGVGRVDWVSKLLLYDSAKAATYPLWDRLFTHSIRPDGDDGLILPYHDYLEPTFVRRFAEPASAGGLRAVQRHRPCQSEQRSYDQPCHGRWLCSGYKEGGPMYPAATRPHRFPRHTCSSCRTRRARFRYRGAVRADRDHDLCFRCFRALRNRMRVVAARPDTRVSAAA